MSHIVFTSAKQVVDYYLADDEHGKRSCFNYFIQNNAHASSGDQGVEFMWQIVSSYMQQRQHQAYYAQEQPHQQQYGAYQGPLLIYRQNTPSFTTHSFPEDEVKHLLSLQHRFFTEEEVDNMLQKDKLQLCAEIGVRNPEDQTHEKLELIAKLYSISDLALIFVFGEQSFKMLERQDDFAFRIVYKFHQMVEEHRDISGIDIQTELNGVTKDRKAEIVEWFKNKLYYLFGVIRFSPDREMYDYACTTLFDVKSEAEYLRMPLVDLKRKLEEKLLDENNLPDDKLFDYTATLVDRYVDHLRKYSAYTASIAEFIKGSDKLALDKIHVLSATELHREFDNYLCQLKDDGVARLKLLVKHAQKTYPKEFPARVDKLDAMVDALRKLFQTLTESPVTRPDVKEFALMISQKQQKRIIVNCSNDFAADFVIVNDLVGEKSGVIIRQVGLNLKYYIRLEQDPTESNTKIAIPTLEKTSSDIISVSELLIIASLLRVRFGNSHFIHSTDREAVDSSNFTNEYVLKCSTNEQYCTGVPFRRLALLVIPPSDCTSSTRDRITALQTTSLKRRLYEGASIIRDLFEYCYSRDEKNVKDLHPTLLYKVLPHLFDIFKIRDTMRQIWMKTLNISDPATQEEKSILLQLLTSETLHVAIITQEILDQIIEHLNKTQHSFKSIAVDGRNVENLVSSINKDSYGSLEFIHLRITGRLAATQFSRLISCAKESHIRLLIVGTSAVIKDVRNMQLQNEVIISKQISKTTNLKVRKYSDDEHSLNQAMHGLWERLNKTKGSSSELILTEEEAELCTLIRQQQAWKAEFSKINQSPSNSDKVIFLVAPQGHVKQFFTPAKHSGVKIEHLDPIRENSQSFMDRVCAKTIGENGEKDTSAGTSTIIVTENAELCGYDDKCTIISRAIAQPYPVTVVFISTVFDPADRVIKLSKGRKITCHVVYARPSNEDIESAWSNNEERKFFPVLYNILRLILPDKLANCVNELTLVMQKVMEDEGKEIIDTLKDRFNGSMDPVTNEVFKSNVEQFVSSVIGLLQGKQLQGKLSTMAMLASVCYQLVTSGCTDVYPSFEDCVKNIPQHQLYAQSHRVYSYIITVFLNNHMSPEYQNMVRSLLSSAENGNNVDSTNLLSYFGTKGEYEPSYLYLQEEQQYIMNTEDILIRCLRHEDLDWKRVGPAINDMETLRKILEVYPWIIRPLACIQPSYLCDILSKANNEPYYLFACERLMKLLLNQDFITLLEPHLMDHLAVIRFGLVRAGIREKIKNPALAEFKFDSGDIERVLALKLGITDISHTAVEILQILASLDKPRDVLTQELELRKYILDRPIHFILASNVGETPTFKIGAAIISAALNPSLRSDAENSSGNLLKHEFIRKLQHLLLGSGLASSKLNQLKRSQVKTYITWSALDERLNIGMSTLFWTDFCRLTPAAFAELIIRCSEKLQVDILIFLLQQMLGRTVPSDSEKLEFVQAVINTIVAREPRLACYSIDQLFDKVIKAFGISYSSLKVETSTKFAKIVEAILSNSIQYFITHKQELPIESSLHLRQIFYSVFTDEYIENNSKATVQLLLSIISSHGFETILEDMENPEIISLMESSVNEEAAKALLDDSDIETMSSASSYSTAVNSFTDNHKWVKLLSYVMNPEEQIQLKADETEILMTLVNNSPTFFAKVNQNPIGMSSLSRFLACRYTMDLLSHNYYAKLIDARLVTQEKNATAAQAGSKEWPAYVVIIHARALPTELLNIVRIHMAEWKELKKVSIQSLAEIEADVSQGVSLEIIQQNVQALYYAIEPGNQPLYQRYKSTFLLLKVFLWSWFVSLGFTQHDLESWLTLSNIQPVVEDVIYTKGVFYPFQSRFNTKWIEKHGSSLFGVSKGDSMYTLQLIEELNYFEVVDPSLKPYKMELPRCFKLLYCVQNGNITTWRASPEYEELPFRSSYAVAHASVALLNLLLPSITQEGRSVWIDLSKLQSVLSSFVELLRLLCKTESVFNGKQTGKELAKFMMSTLLEEAQSKLSHDANASMMQAIIFRVLFSLIGIHRSAICAKLHSILLECFMDRKMQVCGLSVKEARFMIKEKFLNVTLKCPKDAQWSIYSVGDQLLTVDLVQSMQKAYVPIVHPQQTTQQEPFMIQCSNARSLKNEAKAKAPTIFQASKQHLQTQTPNKTNESTFAKASNGAASLSGITGSIDLRGCTQIKFLRGTCVPTMLPGMLSTIVKTGERSYKIVTEDQNVIQEKDIIATYASNEKLWDMLQNLRRGTTLILDGLLIIKGDDRWVPFLNTRLISDDEHVPIWSVLDVHLLLHLKIPNDIYTLLTWIFDEIYNHHALEDGRQSTDSVFEKMSFFRKATNVDNAKLFEIEVQLCNFFDQLFDEMSQSHGGTSLLSIIKSKVNNIEENSDIQWLKENSQMIETLVAPISINSELVQTCKKYLRGCAPDIHVALTSEFAQSSQRIREKVVIHDDSRSYKPCTEVWTNTDYIGQRELIPKEYIGSIFGQNPDELLVLNISDTGRDRVQYSTTNGLPLFFIMHRHIIFELESSDECEQKKQSLVNETKNWLLQILLCTSLPQSDKENLIVHADLDRISPFDLKTKTQKQLIYCLSRACPIQKKKATLKNIVTYNDEIVHLLARTASYGVTVVSSGSSDNYLEKLENVMDTKLLDFTEQYENNSISDNTISLSVINALLAGYSCVYVKGLHFLNDEPFKNIAEVTKDLPYTYVFFEDLNVSHNVPEMIDRIRVTSDYESRMEAVQQNGNNLANIHEMKYNHSVPKDQKVPIGIQGVEDYLSSNCSFSATWRQDTQQKFALEIRVISMQGPPGTGKSFEAGKLLKPGSTSYFDCSSDCTLRRALQDVLKSRIQIDKDKSFTLFADEFHYMNREQKSQLLQFVAEYPNMKLVLIANRSDSTDMEMLKRYFGTNYSVVLCRETFRGLMSVYMPDFNWNEASTADKLSYRWYWIWFNSTRNLFGDLMMTHRLFEDVKQMLDEILKDNNIAAELAKLLKKKNPTLMRNFCLQYVDTLITLFKEEKRMIQNGNPSHEQLVQRYNDVKLTKETSLISLLVKISLLVDPNEENKSCPDHCSGIPKAHEYHLLQKFYTWIINRLVQSNVAIDESMDTIIQNILLRHDVCDVPTKFPRFDITSVATSTDLRSCKVFCRDIDPSDPELIKMHIVRGDAFDPTKVHDYLQKHPTSDVAGITSLAHTYPPILAAIPKENLYALLNMGDSALALAESVLKYFSPAADDSKDPYYTAAWKFYRQQKIDSKTCKFENNDDPMVLNVHSESFSGMPKINRIDLLAWAAKYATNLVDVSCDVQEFQSAIQADLVAVTSNLAKTGEHNHIIIELWSKLFAPLATVGESTGGLSYETGLLIASAYYPPLTDWEPTLKILSELQYNTLTREELDLLYEDREEFWIPSIYESNPKIVANIIASGKNLSKEWQLLILRTEGLTIPDSVAEKQYALIFEHALLQMASTNQTISIADTNFKQLLLQVQHSLLNK